MHPDGALDAVAIPRPGSEPGAAAVAVRLPADYVREHVELGYAATSTAPKARRSTELTSSPGPA